jgi:hypothetical protein
MIGVNGEPNTLRSERAAETMKEFLQDTSTRLRPGERVMWWKRLPGGAYVYPVRAIVLTATAKRVKIEAEDDGPVVIRYVPAESLQRQD